MNTGQVLRRMGATAIAVVLCTVLLTPGSALGGTRVTVRLAREKLIDGPSMTLGQIADVKGGDVRLAEAVRQVELGRSPLPGQSRDLHRDLMALRLRQNGLNVEEVRFEGEEAVTVTAAAMVVSPEMVAAAARRWVEEQLEGTGRNGTIESVHVDSPVSLPVGTLAYRVAPLRHVKMEGKFPLPVELLIDGKAERKVMAVVTVQILQEVVVALRPLKRGHILSSGDIGLQEMDVGEFSSNSVHRLETVLGKRLRRSLETFDVLREDLLDMPPLVNRGDVVQVVAESGNLQIRTLGLVKEKSGHSGERIQVVNMDSNRTIYARVIDEKTVKVDF